ncbi:MAG TPA: hypothetical protein VGH56_13120 [Solirubrobacteraceae bacterium]
MPREVDVAPAERQQLPLPQAGIGGHPHDLAVLAILGALLLTDGGAWPVSAE